jgi:hypothetical protein
MIGFAQAGTVLGSATYSICPSFMWRSFSGRGEPHVPDAHGPIRIVELPALTFEGHACDGRLSGPVRARLRHAPALEQSPGELGSLLRVQPLHLQRQRKAVAMSSRIWTCRIQLSFFRKRAS